MKSGTAMTTVTRRQLKAARPQTDAQLMASAARALPCPACHRPVRPKQPHVLREIDGMTVRLHLACK